MTGCKLERVNSDSAIMMGKPVIKGMRIPVELNLRLSADDSERQFLAGHPRLSIEDVHAAQARNSLIGKMSS